MSERLSTDWGPGDYDPDEQAWEDAEDEEYFGPSPEPVVGEPLIMGAGTAVKKYNEDQARDDHGRWTVGGAGDLRVHNDDGTTSRVYWHGSPNGQLGTKIAAYGLHVGTYQAAKEALEARIGRRADGKDWDGTTEYGKTLIQGSGTGYISMEPGGMEGHYPSPATYREAHRDSDGPAVSYEERDPDKNYNARGAIYSDYSPVPMDAKPDLFPVKIVGRMTNTPHDPHEDFKANGLMHGQIKRGRAKSGYYYAEVGEDAGSIAAVVPSAAHLERLPMPPEHLHPKH